MGRILVVEDDPAMTEGIRDVLELAGHEVLTATDGVEALSTMRRATPDLILSDVMMPVMDGFAFYEQVRRNPGWTFIPFVFLTALGQRESITQGKRLGADDYLIKPVDPDHLLAAVDARLARSGALADAAASELQKFSRLVTGVLGHELRTPITWIRAYSEILLDLRADMGQDELDAALEGIKSGSDRLARVVEDSVVMVSLDTGQAREDYRVAAALEHDLAARVQAIVDSFATGAQRPDVTVSVEAADDLPAVVLAERYFELGMRHLLDNAFKFCAAGDGRVTVSLTPSPSGVELCVSDNGVGIPTDHLERIFEPLVQVNRLRQEQQGIGIGLAICKGVVQLHGGRIWADSAEGGPTRIHFTLPTAGTIEAEYLGSNGILTGSAEMPASRGAPGARGEPDAPDALDSFGALAPYAPDPRDAPYAPDPRDAPDAPDPRDAPDSDVGPAVQRGRETPPLPAT